MSRAVQLVLLSVVILTCLQTGVAHSNDDVASMISAAVHEILLPIMKEIKNDLNSVKNDLSSLNKTVSNLSGNLEDYKQQTASELAGLTSELAGLQSNVTSELAGLQSSTTSELAGLTSELAGLQSNVTSELAGLQSSTTSELAGLHSNVISKLAGLQSSTTSELAGLTSELAGLQNNVTSQLAGLQFNTHSEQLTQLCEKVNMLRDDTSSLKGDLSSLNDSMNRISDNVEAHDNHVTTELMEFDQNLQQNFSLLLNNSCGYIVSPPIHTCGGTGGWRRVVYLNFRDSNTPCPSGWQLTSHSRRTCGRVSISSVTCDSVTFPFSGGDYTKVCGRIIAYQYGYAEGFENYDNGVVTTIDGAYVDGVSLTHGSPRQHIWTFAAGYSEFYNGDDSCPCDATININTPPFVGGNYFCESGWNSRENYTGFFPDDPLWDGDGCTASSTCCSFNNPPYFTKQLPSPTTDDIEARLCEANRAPIEFIELYVQ